MNTDREDTTQIRRTQHATRTAGVASSLQFSQDCYDVVTVTEQPVRSGRSCEVDTNDSALKFITIVTNTGGSLRDRIGAALNDR